MAINFKDIKQNFFINYSKYWIIFFVLVTLYLLNSFRKNFFNITNLTLNVENSVYVTNGVAVNSKYIVVNKDIIESACVGNLSGLQGNFYVIDKLSIYRAVIDKSDSISNIMLLKLKNYEDHLSNYAILQIDQPIYKINRRLIVPNIKNEPAEFNFKESRVIDNTNDGFFLSLKNIFKKKYSLGMPVFNKNYVLQGVVKEINDNYDKKNKEDNILNKLNIQTTYFVNNINTLKKFLDKYNIEYSIISGDVNLNNNKYKPQNSIVNIICIKTY